MFNLSEKGKAILESVKAAFNEFVTPPAPIPAPVPVAATAQVYKTKEGVELSVEQAGEKIAPGDKVSVAGAPAPAGDHTLEDGTTISVDETGIVTAVVESAPAAPVTQPEMSAVPGTPEAMRALYAAFAVGTPEERLANLELVAKSLMEYTFGWQIREAEEKVAREQAIAIYKTGLEKVEQTAIKQKEVVTGMFELVTEMATTTPTEPITVPDSKKEKFKKAAEAQADKFKKIGEAMTNVKTY